MAFWKKAITRTQSVVVIVIIVAAAVLGIAYTGLNQPSQQPSTSTPTSSVVSQTAPNLVDTLSIDEWNWPLDNVNQLYAVLLAPWPNPMSYTVYQPLVMPNFTAEWQEGNIQFLPGLANWTVSSDGLTYTFSLKHNVKFSNGDPLNAYQVWAEMYGFYYLSGNSSSWLENYVVLDMSPVNFGPATLALLQQSGVISPSQDMLNIMMNSTWPIYVTDQYTIVFHLQYPFVWFPGLFVAFDGFIFDTQYVLGNGGFGTPSSFNVYFNTHAIPGTGPYVVTGVSVPSYITFSQSSNYWGANMTTDELAQQPVFDPGHAKNVNIYFKLDDVARYTDLSKNTVQIAAIQSPDWNLVTSNPQTYTYLTSPPWTGEVALLGLNTHVYPTDIRDVRQAIVHAINYTDIYEKAYLGKMTPYMGPEYPAWKDYYDLGNFPPYDYNLTLAKQYLATAELTYSNLTTSMPTFDDRILAGCTACINAAQVIQADLSQIGINVNIDVLTTGAIWSLFGDYQFNVANAAAIGQLAFVNAGMAWGPNCLTPADYWLSFVSNASLFGNYAEYYNPIVQKAVDAFTTSGNVTYIQSLVKAAQAQIYYDAPYAWIGLFGLWETAGGSLVWKTGVVNGFYVDPLWVGQSTIPIFNTVTFGPGAQNVFAQLIPGVQPPLVESWLQFNSIEPSFREISD